MNTNYRIFGVDAGLGAPGFSVIDFKSLSSTSVLLAECFIPSCKKTGSKTTFDRERIEQITGRIFQIVLALRPNIIVAELPTGGSKSGAALRGMAFATAMTATAIKALQVLRPEIMESVEICYITPNQNKKGATGKIKWDVEIEQGKWEVMQAVKAIWPSVQWPMKKKRGLDHLVLDDTKCWGISDSLACCATWLREKKLI